MWLTVYHGTSEGAAEKILREGFKIPKESEEWFSGKGIYFASEPSAASGHGPVILKTEVDTDDFEPSYLHPEFDPPLGTFNQFYERICEDFEGEFGPCKKPTEDEAWKMYLRLAEEIRLKALALGKRGWKSGDLRKTGTGWMEIVVADPEYARLLTVERTEHRGLPRLRTVVMRRPWRGVRVRPYRRRQ